jgi:DNA-binding MarR family transcriptional regulator
VGADLESEVVDALLETPAAVSDLSTQLGVTYAAAHEAASRLVGRGLVRRSAEGRRKVLALTPGITDWLRAFPAGTAARPRAA